MLPSRTVFTKPHGRDFSHQNSTRLRCTAFSRFLKATANTRAHSALSAAPFPGGRRHAHPSRHAPLVPLAPRAPRPAGGKPPSLALEAASPPRAKTEGELPRCRGAPSTAPRRSPARRRFRVRRSKLSPEAPGASWCHRLSYLDSISYCRSGGDDSISRWGAGRGVAPANPPGPGRRQETQPGPAACLDNADFTKSLLSQDSFSLSTVTTVAGPLRA